MVEHSLRPDRYFLWISKLGFSELIILFLRKGISVYSTLSRNYVKYHVVWHWTMTVLYAKAELNYDTTVLYAKAEPSQAQARNQG